MSEYKRLTGSIRPDQEESPENAEIWTPSKDWRAHEDTDTMTMIVGTYDYTRDGMSGENVNVGLRTNSPEANKKAKDFFMEQWNSTDAEEIV